MINGNFFWDTWYFIKNDNFSLAHYNYDKIRDLFKVKLYAISSETKKKGERENKRKRERERVREKKRERK